MALFHFVFVKKGHERQRMEYVFEQLFATSGNDLWLKLVYLVSLIHLFESKLTASIITRMHAYTIIRLTIRVSHMKRCLHVFMLQFSTKKKCLTNHDYLYDTVCNES